MIFETKIDDSFPLGNFLIGGFSKPSCYTSGKISNLIGVETKPIE